MSASKFSPEIQIRMIALLLQKEIVNGRVKPAENQRGVKLFRHFHKVDAETFASTFSFSGIAPIISVLGEYYAKHKDLPSKEVYDHCKRGNQKYMRWSNEASEKDQRKLKEIEQDLFRSHPDESFIEAELVEFITRSFLIRLAAEQSKYLIDGGKTPKEIAVWLQDEMKKFTSGLEEDLGQNEGETFQLLGQRHDVSKFMEVEALETCFTAIRLYFRGLSVLVAPPKSFKTGISQNIALDLMKRGYDVLFIDLENGDVKMNRRFHQALLKCPKEWLYAGRFIDRTYIEEKTGFKFFNPDKTYSKDDQVWRYEHSVEVIEGQKKYTVWAAAYRALCEGAELVEDWEMIDVPLPDECYLPIQEASDIVFDQIREETQGDIQLVSMRGATVERIRAKVERLIENGKRSDTNDGPIFYDGTRPRVLIVDWGQKVKNTNPKLNYWEKHRNNYEQYAELYEQHDLHMLVIEAPQDYSKLSDPHFNPDNLHTAGTQNITYDAVSVSVVLATAEEKAAGFRRIVLVVDRDSPRLQDYIKVDYSSFRAFPVDYTVHKSALPELWSQWEKGEPEPQKRGGKKGKDGADVEERIADFVFGGGKT